MAMMAVDVKMSGDGNNSNYDDDDDDSNNKIMEKKIGW